MKKPLFFLLALILTLIHPFQGAGQVELGKGSAKIALASASLLLNGVKIYPGDQIKLVAQGTVRRNWYIHKEESCFLWWCDETSTPIHNYRYPTNLPVRVHVLSADGTINLNPTGFSLGAMPITITVPNTYPVDKPFVIHAFFDDPGIVRTQSDGEYNVTAYIDYKNRLNLLKSFLQGKGSSLTIETLSSKDLITDLFAKTHSKEIAKLVLDHLSSFNSIASEEKRHILDYVYNLDPTNPRISLSIAKNALTSFDFTTAEASIKKAQQIIKDGSDNDSLLAEAYGVLGIYWELTHSGSLDEQSISESSGFYGMAADHYLKALMYDSAVNAFYNQGRILRKIGTTAALQKSLDVLKQADILSSNVFVVSIKNKFGIVNTFGKTLVKPEFDSIRTSKSLVRPARKNGKWAYIDNAGNALFSFIYDDIGPLNKGIMWAKQQDDYLYIDIKGRQVINEKYKWGSNFFENFAFVVDNSDQFFYINRSGEKFALVAKFAIWQGLGHFNINATDSLLDLLKKNPIAQTMVLSSFYSKLMSREGIHPYNKLGEPHDFRGPIWSQPPGDIGFIDRNGNIKQYANGTIQQLTVNKNYFYAASSGKIALYTTDLHPVSFPVLANQQTYVNSLQNGAYSWSLSPTMQPVGIVSEQFTKISDPVYSTVFALNEQLLYAIDGNNYKIIKTDGTELLSRQVDNSFVNAFVCCYPSTMMNMTYVGIPTAALWGLHNTAEPQFIAVAHTSNEQLGKTKKTSLYRKSDMKELLTDTNYVNYQALGADSLVITVVQKQMPRNNTESGVTYYPMYAPEMMQVGVYKIGEGELVPPLYDAIVPATDNKHVIAITGNKYGVINLESRKLTVPQEYDNLMFFNDTLLQASKNGKVGVITTSNSELISIAHDTIEHLFKADFAFGYLENADISVPQPSYNAYPAEKYVLHEQKEKLGIHSLENGNEVVPAKYDEILMSGDKFACAVKKEVGDKMYVDIALFNTFGSRFHSDHFIYLRHDTKDNIFTAITANKKLKLINSLGQDILVAQIVIADGNIVEQIAKGNYTISDLSIVLPSKQTVTVKDRITKFVKLPGKIIVKNGNALIQINLENGHKTQLPADDIMLTRF